MINVETPLKDVYTWRVVYEDGKTCINENEDNSFADVDKMRAKTIILLSLLDESSYRVDVPDGATVVFFRRRSVRINPISGESNFSATVHCVGWKNDEEAEYHFVFGDGSALVTSDFQAI
jgi:hypothetical protein